LPETLNLHTVNCLLAGGVDEAKIRSIREQFDDVEGAEVRLVQVQRVVDRLN
jgi:hypothetical protein